MLLGAGLMAAPAQTPIPFPYTATTVAGGGATSTGSATTPVACTAGSQYKSYDSYGNGCPGLFVNFNADTRGGIASDGQGNIFIADSSNNMIRKYDPKSGVVSRLVGKGTNCSAASGLQDSSGDGCPSQQTSLVSTPRGIATDPYGNVLFAGYGTQMIHIVCQTASPLCPNTAGHKQIGYMYRIAGCVATSGSTATAGSGTTAGSEGDGTLASPFEDLSGDIADWGGGTAVGTAGTCSGSVGEINQPRGVAADKWGNVYIGETAVGRWRVVLGPKTSSYFTGTNPLYAIIALNPAYPTPAQARIYPLLNGFAAQTASGITYNIPTASGAACQSGTGGSTAISTDAFGDGCQYFATAPSTNTSNVQGVAVDIYGNVYFADANAVQVRAIYAGGANAAANPLYAALVANGNASPTTGFVYTLAGGGGTSVSTTPTLGKSTAISSTYKIAVGPGDNIYTGDTGTSSAEMIDISTGYIRTLFKTGSACAAHVTGVAGVVSTAGASAGDGCPAGSFSFSASNGLGVAPDPFGNLYLMDQNALLRKIEAVSLVPTIVGSTTAAGAVFTQTLYFHGPAGTASMTATALNNSADITVGTINCLTAAGDTTMDCTVPVTFAPAQPGPRTLNLAVTAVNSSGATLGAQVFAVGGNGLGTALVADVATPATATVTGSAVVPAGAFVGAAGNLYYADRTAGTINKYNVAKATTATVGTAPANALQITADTAGNVYATATGGTTVTVYTQGSGGAYTAGSVTLTGVAAPQGIVVDANSNLYVSDKTTGSVFVVPVNDSFFNNGAVAPIVLATGFTNPVGLALDGAGNLFVADAGAPAVYKVANINGTFTTSNYASAGSGVSVTATPGATAATVAPTVTVTGLVPASIAADAGGNVYVQDNGSKKLLGLPVVANSTSTSNVANAGTTVSVLSGLTTPSGVAVDGNGVVYSADSGMGKLLQVQRNAASFAFGTTNGTANATSGTFSNAGNLSTTGFAETTSSEFLFDATGSYTCGTIPSSSNPLYAGGECGFTAYFNPATSGNAVTSKTTFLAASSTTGIFTLTGQEPSGTTFPTTVTISAPNPASPIYTGTGTTATFTVSVAATGTTDVPTGSITVTTSCTTGAGNYALTSGSASVPLAGCTAGSQTISVAYANTPDGSTAGASFGASSNSVGFTVAQAATAVTWSPSATTQQYSAAIGTGVLNATAASSGSAVPGFYLYSATPAGGTARTVHAASFLGIGTYSLSVQFIPMDGTDYAPSTGTVSSYTVTKATTTAGLGSTQMLVSADGTGNYDTGTYTAQSAVQAAINALPATGGAIYIKPGTYKGDVTVVQPSVSMRGLGGDPTAVILTHAGGAFGGSGVYAYAGEFTAAQNNSSQLPSGSSAFTGDEGSATLVVAKGTNTAVSTSQLTPNGFYGENLTLANTYNTDTTTTTTTYLPSANAGTCTANEGPAQTYNALYNQSLLCASQALAIWTTSDLSVMNNVYTTSLQDTIYAGSQGSGSNGYVPARQYWFRGKVTGDVDYIFGDAAAVFDYSSIYSAINKTATGTITIEAQNKMVQTGSTNDYLSGYVMNSDVFTSQSTTQSTDFGRPYGPYSTWIMLNSYVDTVNPVGYIEFSNSTTNLPTSTYAEYNDIPYTDPATGSADLNGVIYNGAGGNSGSGVTGTRETVSQNPGTVLANNNPHTSMSAAQATLYYPTAFLGSTVPGTVSSTTTWNPTTALATNVNAFTGTATSASVVGGTSVTVLMRPQTPGLGAVTNGTYTVPTGTYTLTDTFNGTASTVASGALDASGEAYFTTSTLTAGTHNLTWVYSGDSNFSGSTSASYTLAVTGVATTTTLSAASNPITYGQSASVTATVTPASGTTNPGGTVTLTIDGSTTQTASVSGTTANFTLSGLAAGTHTLTAAYNGATMFTGSSTATAYTLTVNQAVLTVTGSCANRIFDTANACSATVTGYQYTDTASTVFQGTPTGTTTATRTSPAGTYTAIPLDSSLLLTTYGNTNYTLSKVSSSFTITGGVPQQILFLPLPNFAHGASYQLVARTTSGLGIVYTVSGPATVSGNTLTVTGTGTVSVTANSAADATGDYAAASAVTRSFTAQ